ncbi:SRPBCC family protein [Flavobacteriaceae bacterium M23B6Z8]
MTKKIETEILINANPEKVWKILTNQKEYPDWNPFIKHFEGKLEIGKKLKISIQPPNSSQMKFQPKVLAFEKNKILKWKGKFIINGLFDGTHTFELIDKNNGTTIFKQNEIFKGLLVRFFNLKNTKTGFERMNSALKTQSEKL